MTKLKIVAMGTRGKSSMIRHLHNFFYKNNYSVLSRETGLFPIVYDNNKTVFLKREGDIPFCRPLEIMVIVNKFNAKKHDIIVFENNAISETYMRKFNEFINPDVIIITTISLDHLLDQGGSFKDVSQTFINSIPQGTPTIFWTNHKPEYGVFKKTCKKNKVKNFETLFGPLRKREETIFKSFKKILYKKKIKFKNAEKLLKGEGDIPDEISTKINGKTFIDLGHINDVVHTSLALHEIMARKNIKKIYLLFNFRADRLERIPAFSDAFLPLFKNVVEGIIIKSDSIALTTNFLIKRIKKEHFKDTKIKFYGCNDLKDLTDNVLPKIPKGSTIIMVGNTADDFGKRLITNWGLFRTTYPILDKVDMVSKS